MEELYSTCKEVASDYMPGIRLTQGLLGNYPPVRALGKCSKQLHSIYLGLKGVYTYIFLHIYIYTYIKPLGSKYGL